MHKKYSLKIAEVFHTIEHWKIKMEKNRTSELMETVMNKVREMVDVSSAVGEPIVIGDGTTIIPVSRVSFGFASGGSDFTGI